MKLTILNDVHAGADRKVGTTPTSRSVLQYEINHRFDMLLPDNDLMILGDLFDGPSIGNDSFLTVYEVLHTWLKKGHQLYLVPGNHDLSKNSSKMSDFRLLAELLHGDNVCYVWEPQQHGDLYIIPHMENQELFDEALANVPECTYLALHCNYHNNFAAQSDHSLNLSQEVAEKLPVKHILIAHEHQQKQALDGKVVVLGNQIPSSISDCLGNETKRVVTLDGTGYTSKVCWTAEGHYAEVSWEQLDTAPEVDFIRVVGSASGEQSLAAQEAISKFRQRSGALVVSNAVKSGSETMSVEEALDKVKGFNISAALRELVPKKLHQLYDEVLAVAGIQENLDA